MALRLRRGNWKRGVLVNPLGSGAIGRHTGKNVKEGKNIRVTDDGYECFDDYFSASEAESTLEITLHKSLRSSKNNRSVLSDVESNVTTAVPRKKKKRSPSLRLGRDIGWRTRRNVRAGKNIRKDASGFEIFDDYFSESEAESSLSSLSITTGLQSLTSKTIDNDITNGENEVDENGEQQRGEDDVEPAAEPDEENKLGEEGTEKSVLHGDPNEEDISIMDEEDKSIMDEEDKSIKDEEDKSIKDEEDELVKHERTSDKNDEETNDEETDDKDQSIVSTKSQKDKTLTEQDLADSDQPETNHSHTDDEVQFMDDERRDYLRRKSRSEKTINVSSVSLKDGDNYSYREYQTILKSSRKSNFVKLSQTLPSVISYFPDGTPSVEEDPDNVTDIVAKEQTSLSVAAVERTCESAKTQESIQTQSGINTGGELTGSITKNDAVKKSSPINSFKTKKRLSYSGVVESFIESTSDNLNQSKYRNKKANKSNLVSVEEDVILNQSAFHQQVEDPQQSDDTENLYIVDQRDPSQVYHLDEIPRNGPRRGRSFDKIQEKMLQPRKSEFNGANVSISVVNEIHKNLQLLNQASADRSFQKERSKNSDSVSEAYSIVHTSSRSLRKSTRNSSKNSISINGNNEELSDSRRPNNLTLNKSRNVTESGKLIYDALDCSSSDTIKSDRLDNASDELSQTSSNRSHLSRLSKKNSFKLNKSGRIIDKSKIDTCEQSVNGLDDVSQLETTNRSLRSSNRTLSKSNNSKLNKSGRNNTKSVESSETYFSENGVSQLVNKTLQKTLADKDTSTSGLPSGSSTKNRKSTKEIETNTTPMDLTDAKTLNNDTRKRHSNDESDLGMSDKMKKLTSDKENISTVSEDSVIMTKSRRRTVVIDDNSDVVPSESVYCQSQDMSIQELDGDLPASIAESTRIDESFLRKIPLDTPKSGVSIRHRRSTAGRLSAINSLHRTAMENNQVHQDVKTCDAEEESPTIISTETTPTLTPCLVQPGTLSAQKKNPRSVSINIEPEPQDSPEATNKTYGNFTGSICHFQDVTDSESPPIFKMPQKSKIIYPEPAPEGIRRSRRVRVQTLESHKMERIVYDYRRRSGVHVMAIQPSNEAKYLAHSEKLAQARLKRNKLKKAKQRRQKDGRNLSMHTVLPDDLEMTFGHELPIINPETNEEVFVDCIAQQDSVVYIGPNGDSPKASDPFVMCRAVNQRSFSAGEIILRGLAEKPLQRVTSSTLIFRILHGKLAVTIHRKVTVLETGDSFFIPLDTTYSLRNLRNEEAKLSYVNILKME